MSLEEHKQVIASGRYIRMVRQGSWEYVERIGLTGIVAIVAVTEEAQLVLVEQYRPPVGQRVIEIPAGLAGDEADRTHEALEDAAHRELLEETGFRAGQMEFLTDGPPSSGVTNEHVTFFLATGLDKIEKGGGDAFENIAVHLIDVSHVETWLRTRRDEGFLIDPKTYLALFFAAKHVAHDSHTTTSA